MKIRTKILMSFSLVAALGVILGIVGIASTQMMTKMSNELIELKETGGSITEVVNAHFIWRQGITEAVLGKEFTGSLDPTTCAFGKWKNSDEAKNITDPEVLESVQKIDEPHTYIHTNAKAIVDSVANGNMEEAAVFLDDLLPHTQEVITGLTDMETRYSVLQEEKNREIVVLGHTLTAIIIAIIILAVIASILLALYIAGYICTLLIPMTSFLQRAGATGNIATGPQDEKIIGKYSRYKDELGKLTVGVVSFLGHVTNISNELETVADGDLRNDIKPLSPDDIMGNSLKKVVNNLSGMFKEISNSSSQVTMGSNQIADGAQSLASGSTQQAATLEELSASVSDIANKTKENAERTNNASALAENIMQSAETGTKQMEQMINAVNEINTANQNISKVIKTIDDIAFQTNILALNASVEAARAGAAGKGFAVVAEEVRNLATKSAESAKDTSNLVANSIEKAKFGAQIAGETSESLSQIVSGISESNQIIDEIARSSDEQSEAIDQINIGINGVTQVVQQNSATAEEAAAASEEMSGQANTLEDLLKQFKLK